jgi:ammonium transporter, Amt family
MTQWQWFFWGYSLVFSKSASKFLGNMENVAFMGVLAQKSGFVPDILYALFQGMFAAFTPAIVIGAAAERGRILPCLVFVLLWSTLVYDPIASWTWNPSGWAYDLGVLDFAGGTPVHISSGAAALAFAWKLGPRYEKLDSRVRFISGRS